MGQFRGKSIFGRFAVAGTAAGCIAALTVLSGCANRMQTSNAASSGTKEYFSEAEYGVKASPRVALSERSRLDRSGARDHIGKPYKVKGRWYYPKSDPHYDRKGLASWYGSAFNGRLTANGEIYDMNRLTAAHPTMPLPSYARVTNLANGSSVVVRVNDRGPFEASRLIDLSRHAAELLDYKDNGVAKVRVQYIGRAPLDVNDESYLLASYRPGPNEPPLPGVRPDVMVAMAGSTVDKRQERIPFPAGGTKTYGATPIALGSISDGDPILPENGPVLPERPNLDLAMPAQRQAVALLGYAQQRVISASSAFDQLLNDRANGLTPQEIVASWKRSPYANSGARILVGTYASNAAAQEIAGDLDGLGSVTIETEPGDKVAAYTVSLDAAADLDVNSVLRAVWSTGSTDAFIVHD